MHKQGIVQGRLSEANLSVLESTKKHITRGEQIEAQALQLNNAINSSHSFLYGPKIGHQDSETLPLLSKSPSIDPKKFGIEQGVGYIRPSAHRFIFRSSGNLLVEKRLGRGIYKAQT